MAGSYPDVPGYRFAYDVDGTIAMSYALDGNGIITSVTPTVLSSINRDVVTSNPPLSSTINVAPGSGFASFVFPEPRSITGYFLMTDARTSPGPRVFETSDDTTNGQDGTWTTRLNPYTFIDNTPNDSSPYYRATISTVNWTGVTAVRLRFYAYMQRLHLYGSIPTIESVNRLRVVDLSDVDIAAQLDFGNIKQRASSTRQFKVINNSSSQTANTITVSLSAPSDASPSLIGQYQISTDNVAFANAVNIGSLAPGASSGIIYIRNNVASTAQLGPWTARIIAHPVSWS